MHSAQDTLPFRQMYPDGLCKLDDHTWAKCIEFEDVNYQLAKPDDQTAIFEALCDMYNAHDASIGMQLSLVSRRMNREDFVKRIEIAAQGDHFDHIRELYTQMLRKQLERGNNGLIKTKYLTLTIEARDSKTARARFSRIVMDALNHFKVMGALAKELGGKEWLEMLHGILHPDGDTPTSGHIWIDEQDLFSMKEEQRTIFRRRNIGFIFQSFQLVSELNVEQNIMFPLLLDYRKPDPAAVEEILELLGLTERRHHLPSQLSGGQQQRVAIGRALITKPKLILADEPTGNLDSKNSQDVIALLTQASRRYQQTILMITHNKDLTASVDRVFRVSDGVLTDLGGKTNEALS